MMSVFSLETMRRIRVKSRALYVFICCIAVTSVLLLMTNNQRPTINTIVTETKKQLTNLKNNFKEEKRLKVDKLYLHFLGLVEENESSNNIKKNDEEKDLSASESAARTVVPWTSLSNITDPVIVSAVFSGASNQAVHFLRNIFTFRPESTVVLFDMGLGGGELDGLIRYCNGSMSESALRIHPNSTLSATATRHWSSSPGPRRRSVISESSSEQRPKGWCYVAPFDPLEMFPSFVRSKAYRPLAIQQVHRYVGCCILWLEIDQRLTNGNLKSLLNSTRSNGGVATWLRENTMPTTSLTHPKMFEYLVTSSKMEDYNFQHMISLNAMIVFSTPSVTRDLMLPWVQCSLLEECIEPIGAQATGCRFDKKPQFRYSGCHSYDVSALNIILGQMFNFDESKYISDFKFFAKAINERDDEDDDEVDEKSNETSIAQSEVTIGINNFVT